ncbi:hypothetical protein C1645_746293, partial [Glomus cerebriforme]
NTVSKESAERLEAEYRKNIADYNELIGKYSGLQESRNDLSRRNESRLRQEGISLRENLADARQQLTIVGEERNNLLISSEQKNQEIQTLTTQMTTLRLEGNQTHQELTRIQEERDERITPLELQELLTNLNQREEEVNSLKNKLNQAEEGKLTQKLRSEENRLEKMAKKLEIDWDIVQVLRDNYEELIRARKNFNRDEIKICQNNIETIRQSLLGGDFDTDDLQDVAEKCEKVAELRIELEQQLEARIEVPLNNN